MSHSVLLQHRNGSEAVEFDLTFNPNQSNISTIHMPLLPPTGTPITKAQSHRLKTFYRTSGELNCRAQSINVFQGKRQKDGQKEFNLIQLYSYV